MDIIYKSGTANETIELSHKPFYLTDETDLFDYSWKYSDSRNTVKVISRPYTERKFPIFIKADNIAKCEQSRNYLCEIFDNDVMNNKPGRIYTNGYYIECFVISSKKNMPTIRNNHALIDFTVVTKGNWTKESNYMFSPDNSAVGGFDFEYDFEFDYGLENAGESYINNEHFYESDFVITVSGQCSKPYIVIGDNIYTVDVELESGDNLFINSKEKTIYIMRANGTYENAFANRDREHYIFEPIKSGRNRVSWNGDYRWDISLFEERSEPKWT